MAASVFTNLTLRFTLLRIVCAATILQIIESVVRIKPYFQVQNALPIYYMGLAILGLVLVHHIASAFGPRFSLPGLLDILLVFVEIGLCLPVTKVASWYPREVVLYFALLCVTWVTLVLVALLRIGEAIQRGPRYLWTRYDITGAKWAHSSESESGSAGGGAGGKPLKPYHVLFGTALWKVHFPGESRTIIVFRGILGALLIVAVPIFSVIVVIIEPVYETGLTPFKGMKSDNLPHDFRPSDQPVWNVLLIRKKLWVEGGDNNPDFSPAISVTPLWNSNTSSPPCTFVAGSLEQTHLPENLFAFDVLQFRCPPRIQFPTDSQPEFFPTYDEDIRPDLLVTVNFARLNISSTSILDGAINSVQVMLGLSEVTANVLQATPPTTLLPGMNVIGMTRLSIRQKFGKATVAALGVDSYETFLISELVDISPDPQASISKLIPRSPEIATLRIISLSDYSETTIIQDYREKSIPKGFATIGGLWTFLGGIFTALFGSSIMRILFDSKPLSVFGLTRSFKGDNIREAYLQAYPRLITDLQTRPEDRGLVCFISDHLVDFAFLSKGTGPDSDPDQASETIQRRNDDNDDEKPKANLVQETVVTPLLPRSILQVHSSSSHNYDVGLRIWGFDPHVEGRLEGDSSGLLRR